jgi:hypothetical protein
MTNFGFLLKPQIDMSLNLIILRHNILIQLLYDLFRKSFLIFV